MHSKKGFALTLIVVLLAILGIGSVLFVTKNKKVEAPVINNPTSTITTTTSCTPKWTCGWGPCKNGYQGMTAVDSNNCGLSNVGVDVICPALARQCVSQGGENSFCGGIAGIKCASGLTCKLDGTYSDAGGKCIK